MCRPCADPASPTRNTPEKRPADTMNIHELSNSLHEELNGLVTSVRRVADRGLAFELECDDWAGTDNRRHFTVVCGGLVDTNMGIGVADAITLHSDHPLLLEHHGRQGDLYFSSKPLRDTHEIYAYLWDILTTHYQDWIAPSGMLGSPSPFRATVEGGYGLLFRGPVSVLSAARERIGNDLTTQLIETYTAKTKALALIVGNHHVLCHEVEVVEPRVQNLLV